jgi:redox-sensitive bicupin YhaK (pirin superfamily)
MAGTVDVRRAADRATTQAPWLVSKHSFSFGPHYDPANTHFGLLLAHNEDVVQPSTGFEKHPHRDMEIVTWVLRGSLTHQDSNGHSGVIYPGLAQRMSAGRGVNHSEKNDSDEPVRFVQMWVVPDAAGLAPGYEQLEVELGGGGLVPVASGRPGHESAIRINQKDAAFFAARLGPAIELPAAPYLHVFVASGSVELEGAGWLGPGDAARITGSGGQRVTATEPAEILVWEMHASLGGLS